MKKPQYSQTMLGSLTFQTKDIVDHARLIVLYQNLHDQGDIEFSDYLRRLISAPPHFFRFVKGISNLDDLCDFNLKLLQLQQKGFAIVTCMLNRRIAFQREMILNNNINNQNL